MATGTIDGKNLNPIIKKIDELSIHTSQSLKARLDAEMDPAVDDDIDDLEGKSPTLQVYWRLTEYS